jgi:hypothetical protein
MATSQAIWYGQQVLCEPVRILLGAQFSGRLGNFSQDNLTGF